MSTQFIRQLIAENKNPLEMKDGHYIYKYVGTSDAQWKKDYESVITAIQAKENWENAEQLIKKLISEGTNPLEKIEKTMGKHNIEVYKHRQFVDSESEWQRAVERVTAGKEEEYVPRRTLPSAAAPGPGSHMAMTKEEFDDWRRRNGYEIKGGGRHSRRHSRRHPRRHRGSRSGSSRMRSKGKRTYKKRNMRH